MAPGAARALEIDYTANTFSAPERIRFKIRLEGYDTDWCDSTQDRRALYTNLHPGDYRFRVIARNTQGIWNEGGASLDFHLAPFF